MKNKGSYHPLTKFNRFALKYFLDLGFEIHEGNEIESEWYNFDSLNVPADHPSRDMQDTFWLASKNNSDEKKVMRTHNTSSELQIIKENNIKPPFRIVVPGRDYRNERTDQSHEHTFYQIDGIIVEEKVNFGHLVEILSGWFKYLYGDSINIRTRPSFFPFVEPGLEMDVQLSDGKWREMLGAGMAHPTVLKNMGIDPEKYQGIMWGTGIDRFAMLKYHIDDIRTFHSQDLRSLKQF